MINREHKDRLFKMIFGRPENRQWTLSLYNVVNGSSYEDPSEIEYNTMEDVLYMGMKNDISFILDMWMNLYDHQSTFNPNMPVRSLLYLGSLWSKTLIGSKRTDIYGKRLIELPAPKFVVFYNGTQEEPDEQELYLSEAFPEDKRTQADIELKVRMININRGHNEELLGKCRPLYEYSWLVDMIREYSEKMTVGEAADKALDEMPEDFGIKEFLIANREEVRMSILTEYDEEKLLRVIEEQTREDLNDLIVWLLKQGRQEELIQSTSDAELQKRLIAEMRSEKNTGKEGKQ